MAQVKCYLVDIDGTVADGKHREHLIKTAPKNWDAYYDLCHKDAPILHMRGLIHALWFHAHVVFVSGRRESTRTVTAKWLRDHGFWHAEREPDLYMRPDKDFRQDDIVKLELLRKLRADGFEPIMVFDDRDRVVKMWRDNGILCAQVAPGDF